MYSASVYGGGRNNPSNQVRQARIPVGVQILLGMLTDEESGAQDGASKRVRVREEELLSAQATLLSGTCEFGLGVLLEQMRGDASDEALATAQPPAPALVMIDGKGQKTLSTNMRLPMHLPHQELVEAERRLAQLLHSSTAADESSLLGLTTSEAERSALRDEMRHAMQQEEARLRALEEAERAAEEAEEADIAAEIAAEMAAEAKRETEVDRTTVTGEYYFKTSDGTETDNNLLVKGLEEFLFKDSRWEGFVLGTYQNDNFQAWEQRIGGYAGPAYRLIEGEPLTLKLRAGAGASYEFPSSDWTPELLFGDELVWTIDDRSKLRQAVEVYPDIDEFGEYRLIFRVDYDIALSEKKDLMATAGVRDEFDSYVDTDGGSSNDIKIYVGLKYAF